MWWPASGASTGGKMEALARLNCPPRRHGEGYGPRSDSSDVCLGRQKVGGNEGREGEEGGKVRNRFSAVKQARETSK